MSLEERVASLEKTVALMASLLRNHDKQIGLVNEKTEVLSDWTDGLSKQIYDTLELMKLTV